MNIFVLEMFWKTEHNINFMLHVVIIICKHVERHVTTNTMLLEFQFTYF